MPGLFYISITLSFRIRLLSYYLVPFFYCSLHFTINNLDYLVPVLPPQQSSFPIVFTLPLPVAAPFPIPLVLVPCTVQIEPNLVAHIGCDGGSALRSRMIDGFRS